MGASASSALTAADLICNTDSNKPSGGGTYKALLASSLRRACTSANCGTSGASEHSSWILAASTTYLRADGSTTVGTTTSAGIFSFPLTSSLDAGHDSVATGLNSDWTTSTDNCTDWTVNSGSYVVGYSGGTSVASVNSSTNACSQSAKLICVEQ
jgi:hypothetical protein